MRAGIGCSGDDAEDARICCLLALDRHTTLRQLIPHGEIAGELRDHLVRAKATSIRLAASQLLALHDARRRWEQRMAELLLGGPRTGRDRTMTDSDPGKAFGGGGIYLSMPGLGDRLAARVTGEIGDHIHQYETPNALQCYAGSAPVTRRSGKSDFVLARRLAHNHYLGDAVHHGLSVASPKVPGPVNFMMRKSPRAKATMPLCAP